MPSKFGGIAVEDKPSGSSKFGGVAVDDAPPDTRGIDKFPGGSAPGLEKPDTLPNGAVAKEDAASKPFDLERSIDGGSFPGPIMAANGIRDLFTRAIPAAANGNAARAAHETISGVGRAALPLAAPALIEAPVAAGAGMLGSYLGSKAGRFGAKALRLNPDQSDLMEDIGGIAGGGVASPKVRAFAGGAAMAAPEAIKSAALPELASLALHGTPRKIAAGLAAIQATPAIVRGGMNAAAKEPWIPRGLFSKGPVAPPQRGLLNAGPIITEPPVDGSFVRGASAMAHPPNPARALPAAPRVIVPEAPPDASFVRGVPAEVARPESRIRGLLGPAPKPALITPPPADTSFVRGIPAEYPVKEFPARPSSAPPAIAGAADMSDILQRSIDRVRASERPSVSIPPPQSGTPLRVRRR